MLSIEVKFMYVQWQNARVAFPAFEIKLKGDVLSHVLGVLKTVLNFSDLLESVELTI